MNSEVTDLIAALRDGSMSLDEVASRFRERSWERTRKPIPTSYLEMAAAAQEDPDPYVPGSFDEVAAAYRQGELSRPEYRALANAVAESIGAEDQREGDGQS
jgi:hypothetical protein